MPAPHHPSFTITPRQLTLVAEMGERDLPLSPQLRKLLTGFPSQPDATLAHY